MAELHGARPSRATAFLAAIRAIEEAVQKVETLEDGLFGYQRDEVVAAKVLVRQAEQRLVAVANLRGPIGPPVRRSEPVSNV